MYDNESAKYVGPAQAAQNVRSEMAGRLSQPNTPTQPGIISALEEQDRVLTQLWQVIEQLEERTRVISMPEKVGTTGSGGEARPVPDRVLERLAQSNQTIARQAEKIARLIQNFAL